MKFKKSILLFLCIISLSCLTDKAFGAPGPGGKILKRIVIDPGHGGKDFGASGRYSYEKNVALAIALKLQQAIYRDMPHIEVFLTRTTDIYDNVHVKAEKANAVKGDLFISIHCNYDDNKNAKGTETYVWGVQKTGQKEKALRENASVYEDSTLANFNPNDPAQIVAISLKTQQYADRSRTLALMIEDEFKKMGRNSREAKQRARGIWVLQAVAMPAILIETGFISNPEEEDYLNSEKGQSEIADAIVNVLKRYQASLISKVENNRYKTPD